MQHLARCIGMGFHPDTRGAEYEPPLSPEEARALDLSLTRAQLVLGERVYEVALEVFDSEGWT